MTNISKQRWHLVRESIKFQIKLTLDAVRDLLLSPVAIICTLLDLLKGNSKHQGYFHRLMIWGHNTDHWLNLFGDLPLNKNSQDSEHTANKTYDGRTSTPENSAESTDSEALTIDKSQVDSKLDILFSKIEIILEEQQQAGGLTKTAKQKIAYYLALLSANRQPEQVKKSSMTVSPPAMVNSAPNDEVINNSTATK